MFSINLWSKIISQLPSMQKHFFIEGVWFWSIGCRHTYILSLYHDTQTVSAEKVLPWWVSLRNRETNMLMTWRQWSTTLLFQMSLPRYFHFCWHLLHVTKCILPIQQLIKQVSVCSEIKLEHCYRVISPRIIINNILHFYEFFHPRNLHASPY